MASPIQQNLEKKNAEYSADFSKGDLPLPPGKHYLVVTCMDARIDPCAAFGIDLGDAHVIRNAGGCVRDALRSVVISQQLLGTREILVVKHTDCGMLTFTNDDIRAKVKENLGAAAAVELATLDYLPFPDVEQAVRDDLSFLKEHTAATRGDTVVSGWVYDVKTGKVKSVA
ncbi:carbonic anhydrase [Apiospora aurea]|uniref:Carbonic anhydrase n=1 Tax=Apiospora aurea TaxID=335848 RepID=A0ABR1PRL2_9PEZI